MLETVQADLTFPMSMVTTDKQNETTCTKDNEETKGLDSDSTTGSKVDTIQVFVPPTEYMLGVSDLTGELMRLAINSVGAGNLGIPFEICKFLRKMESSFESLSFISREMRRKMQTLKQSLRKVETACYTLQVRGSEIPKHMLVDVFSNTTNEPMYQDDFDD